MALIAILTAISAGKSVKTTARASLQHQAQKNLGYSSWYVAESIAKKLENLEGVAVSAPM